MIASLVLVRRVGLLVEAGWIVDLGGALGHVDLGGDVSILG